MRSAPALLLLAACASAPTAKEPAPTPIAAPLADAAPALPTAPPARGNKHLVQPDAWLVDEEATATLRLDVRDAPAGARLFVERGLPPGAVFDEDARTITFRPDFTQGGWQSLCRVRLRAPGPAPVDEQVVFAIGVKDTIRPPAPVLVRTESRGDADVAVLRQTTDAFLDGPGFAGRTFEARVVVPKGAGPRRRLPVHVELHGVGGSSATATPRAGHVTILPDDPHLTYWWGYAEGLPGAVVGPVRPYTQRRVLHLLEWTLKTIPGADADRVSVGGWSMGGAGALALALLHPRHFAAVVARDAATIARLHRPERRAQLSTIWGAPEQNLDDGDGMGVWDRLDLTRALRDDPATREVFVVTKHGKDDFLVRFDALVGKSPLTGLSFKEALERFDVARVVVWDEGGHGPPDPARPAQWWDGVHGVAAEARRDRAHVAFVASTSDADPGDGKGNGRRAWDQERGYAGDVKVSGDTGWNGDLAGGRGIGLFFKGASVVDRTDRFEIPLMSSGQDAIVDVVPRRLRAFKPRPGDVVRWSCGGKRGIATVKPDGTMRLSEVPISTEWSVLVVERSDLSPTAAR